MAHHRIRFFFWILVPVLILGTLGYLSVRHFFDPNSYRKIVQDSLTTALGKEVTFGNARISLAAGVGVVFDDFRIRDRSGTSDLFYSKKLILRAELLPLLRKEIRWKRVILENPTLRILRDKKGQFNFFHEPLSKGDLKTSQQKFLQVLSSFFGGSLTLRGGVISYSDESLQEKALVTEVRDFHLQIDHVSFVKPFPFEMKGTIRHAMKEARFSISGALQDIPEDMDLSKGRIKAKVDVEGIDVFHFWPYLQTLLPMKAVSGILDLKGNYQGNFSGPFEASAKIKMKDFLFDYPQVFAYTHQAPWINVDLAVQYNSKDVQVSRLSLELPKIWVKGRGKIYGIGSREMGMDAEAHTGPFDISEGRKFIPFRVITPDVSDHLFRAEGSGIAQVLSVKLSGKMNEIEHCDLPPHAHTLSVEMKLDHVRLKLPWDLPAFEDLEGLLLFKEGDLHLKDVEGRVFHSRMDRINGLFHQLLLIPTLQLHGQGSLNLTDLPSLAKIEGLSQDLSEIFPSVRVQSGTANFQVSVKGILKPPLHFQHHGSYHLSRTRFTHQQIPYPITIGEGRIELSNEIFQWSGVKADLGNSSLILNGSLRKQREMPPFEILFKGRVDFRNLYTVLQSPLFPEEIRQKVKGIEGLSGTAECTFHGRSSRGTGQFVYEGEVHPREVSLYLKKVSSPVIFREGSLSFSSLGASFSKTRVQFTTSSLTLDGWIKEGALDLTAWGSIDFKPLHSLLQLPLFQDQVRSYVDGIQEIGGKAEVRLKWRGKTDAWEEALREGEIRLKETFLQIRDISAPFSLMDGSVSFSPERIRFDGLKGRFGNSSLVASGLVSRIPGSPDSPRMLSFQIASPHFDIDPLFPKKDDEGTTSFAKLREFLSNWSVDGQITMDQLKYRNLHLRELKVGIKSEHGKTIFYPLQFKAEGGDVWGEGWLQPTETGVQFEIKPRISNVEAKPFFRTLFQKGEDSRVLISGRVHLDKVELRGEGIDFQQMKESLNGHLRFEVEKGVIERFNLLSKIFSILNVSQLLMGRLPDLKTKGLPYHQVIANFSFQDGIASTENFLVDSDSMRVTIFGKVDIGKKQIDAKVGVHPLVTVDKVISNVPIAGYILTGRDKAFLSYVYEVKGDVDDPKIEAIPFKSMGEGLWGIIKRTLETPLRPFQNAPPQK